MQKLREKSVFFVGVRLIGIKSGEQNISAVLSCLYYRQEARLSRRSSKHG